MKHDELAHAIFQAKTWLRIVKDKTAKLETLDDIEFYELSVLELRHIAKDADVNMLAIKDKL